MFSEEKWVSGGWLVGLRPPEEALFRIKRHGTELRKSLAQCLSDPYIAESLTSSGTKSELDEGEPLGSRPLS